MKFTSQILVLKVVAKTFTNAKNEEIKYNRATFLDENGDIVQVTCTQEVLDTLGKQVKVEGTGTFEVSPDFNGKPRLNLTSFTEKSSRK